MFRVANYLWITRNTRNYPEYPELPESKKDTQKYPIVFFNTPTRPEPDPLPGIFSNTRPDIEKPYPLGTGRQRSEELRQAEQGEPDVIDWRKEIPSLSANSNKQYV